MDMQDSFAEVERKLRAGEQGAATEIFRRFVGRLVNLARTKLDARIRRKEDPEEVVQSVYRIFFNCHRVGKVDLATWESLWSLLAVITVRKCVNRRQYYRAKRRNVANEVDVARGEDGTPGPSEAIDHEQTPLEELVFAETVEQMMRGLDADDRTIIELSLEGQTPSEIRKQVGRSERTVVRLRDRIKKRLQRMQADEMSVP